MTELFPRFLFHPPDGSDAGDVEWLMRVLILHGASDVGVDVNGKEVKCLRFKFRPGGPEHRVDYTRPARPYLVISRGAS